MQFKIVKDEVSPRITEIIRRAKNPERVLRAMGTTFKSITEGTFNSVGADFRPSPWAAKSDGSASNLQRSTTLAKSFQLEVTERYAVLSNPMVYAGIHQFGGTIVARNGRALSWVGADGKRVFAMRVRIPARPFYPVTAEGRLIPKAEELIARAGERALGNF